MQYGKKRTQLMLNTKFQMTNKCQMLKYELKEKI
jgi:hypothetical protein